MSVDATRPRVPAPASTETFPRGGEVIRQAFASQGISENVASFMLKAWRPGTRASYGTSLEKWLLFARQRKVNAYSPPLVSVLDFLMSLVNQGLGYSSLNSARSALSTIAQIDGQPAGKNFHVCKFLAAVFNDRPALPKNVVIWDTSVVIDMLRSWSPVANLPVSQLVQKLVVLMLLISGHRGQSLHLLDVRNMNLTFSYATFTFGDVLKTTKPGKHIGQLTFKAYAPDRRLCVVTVLKEYLKRTLEVRGKIQNLLLTTTKPTKAASRDTIRRWTKNALIQAGIDMTIFSPHSTRSASTSKAQASKLPLKTILQTAGWSTESTFSKYYCKEITKIGEFAEKVLDN